MPSYRCYFLNDEDHIQAVENVDAELVWDAIDRALAMLKARPHTSAVEVWEGARRLYPAQYASVLRNERQS